MNNYLPFFFDWRFISFKHIAATQNLNGALTLFTPFGEGMEA